MGAQKKKARTDCPAMKHNAMPELRHRTATAAKTEYKNVKPLKNK